MEDEEDEEEDEAEKKEKGRRRGVERGAKSGSGEGGKIKEAGKDEQATVGRTDGIRRGGREDFERRRDKKEQRLQKGARKGT